MTLGLAPLHWEPLFFPDGLVVGAFPVPAFSVCNSPLGWGNPIARAWLGCGQVVGWRWALGSRSSLMTRALAEHRRACEDAEMPHGPLPSRCVRSAWSCLSDSARALKPFMRARAVPCLPAGAWCCLPGWHRLGARGARAELPAPWGEHVPSE